MVLVKIDGIAVASDVEPLSAKLLKILTDWKTIGVTGLLMIYLKEQQIRNLFESILSAVKCRLKEEMSPAIEQANDTLDNVNLYSLQTSSADYIDHKLRKSDSTGFKAAGVLLYRSNKRTGNIEYLLAENLKDELTLLGGKIDKDDKSEYDTALREFNEETSLLLDPKLVAAIRKYLQSENSRGEVMWHGNGKYALCMLPVEAVEGLYEATDDLPRLMSELRTDEGRWNALPAHCRETNSLRWVPLEGRVNHKLSRFLAVLRKSNTFRTWLRKTNNS